MKYTVYLVEDEENLNQLLVSYLENEGWDVKSFCSGREAQRAIDERPHLWILDIMLPDIDGYQLIGEIKKRFPSVPVIFISARDADLDRIIGLEKGSDDYLAKPFTPRELILRARKLLERVYSASGEHDRCLVYNGYIIDSGRRKVFDRAGNEITLTSKEFDLLVLLCEHIQQALSRGQILDGVWGQGYFGTDRAVDDLVRRLRKKLANLNIETLYGFGYRLVDP